MAERARAELLGTILASEVLPMDLTGPEKAVLMLLSLDEAAATPIVSELDPADVRKLREVATMMRAVPASALNQVYEEFVAKGKEAVAVPRGGVRYLRRIASSALGEKKTDEIFLDSPQSAMERIENAEATSLAAVLEGEHPQLVAAILSQLEPDRAAAVLEGLPEELRPVVLERLGTMTEVPAGLLEEVACAITEELPPAEAEASMSVDGVSRSAALVRKLGRDTCEQLLGTLEEDNDVLASEIRRAMYSFEDLKMIEPRSLRELLRSVPGERLTLALKTASDDLKGHLFSSMSKRAADLIRDDLDMLGSVRLAEVEQAQQEIVETALRLETEGTLSLGGEDDQLV